jgi:hypothetical protein
MPTQQQVVSSERVQPCATAAQPAGVEADAVMYFRESSMPQPKSSVAADLSPIALTNLSPDSFSRSYQDPQNQTGPGATASHRSSETRGFAMISNPIL